MTKEDLNNPIFDYNKKYDLFVDADSLIFKAVMIIVQAEQKGLQKCIVTHKASKRVKEFDSFELFNEWLGNNPKWTVADFNVNSIAFSCHTLNIKFKEIENLPYARSCKFYIGGVGNFRKDIYPEYKGNRPPKPALFDHVYNHVKRKNNVIVVDGFEAEDWCGADAYSNTVLSDPQNSTSIICKIDKDLQMIAGWHLNYDYLDTPPVWQDDFNAFHCLCQQLLKGDKQCDNIKGIDFVTEELTKSYKFRKCKSIGDVTAKKLLDGCNTKQELIDRVCHIYQLSYGDDNWKKELDFTGKLVYISKYKGVYFCVDKFIKGDL